MQTRKKETVDCMAWNKEQNARFTMFSSLAFGLVSGKYEKQFL
jgi:aryl-alcohol dehydrogenase-like predicted oxidoreductase